MLSDVRPALADEAEALALVHVHRTGHARVERRERRAQESFADLIQAERAGESLAQREDRGDLG